MDSGFNQLLNENFEFYFTTEFFATYKIESLSFDRIQENSLYKETANKLFIIKENDESLAINVSFVRLAHHKQLFIPKGFAHGFLVLSESAKVYYKVDNFYNPHAECGLNYNDPLLNIDWKINSDLIIVNKKDTDYPLFNSKNHFSE